MPAPKTGLVSQLKQKAAEQAAAKKNVPRETSAQEDAPEEQDTKTATPPPPKTEGGGTLAQLREKASHDHPAINSNPLPPPVPIPKSLQPVTSGMNPQAAHTNLTMGNDGFLQFLQPEVKQALLDGKPLPAAANGQQGLSNDQLASSRSQYNDELKASSDYLMNDFVKNRDALSKYYIRGAEQAPPAKPSGNPSQQNQMPAIGDMINKSPGANVQQIGQGGVLDPADFAKRLADTKGDTKALTDYMSARVGLLDQTRDQQIRDLESRYPIKYRNESDGMGHMSVAYRDDDGKYEQEKNFIEKQYNATKSNLSQAAFNLASMKAVNTRIRQGTPAANINPVEIGMEVNAMLGNGKAIDEQKATLRRGQKLSPNDKVANEFTGYRAMNVAAAQAHAEGRDQHSTALANATMGYEQKILDGNPEYKKGQLVRALSDEIYKGQNPVLASVWDKSISKEDIESAGKKLGLRKEDYSTINPDDINNPHNFFKTTLSGFIEATAAPLYEFGMRHIVAPVAGVDQEALDKAFPSNWYDNSWYGKTLKGEAPASGMDKAPQSVVSTDQKDRYLQDVDNPDAGKRNWGLRPIVGHVADGIGTILGFANLAGDLAKVQGAVNIGEKAVIAGKSIQATKAALGAEGLATVAKNADHASIALTTFVTSWDNNYKAAQAAIGDKPEDENKRAAYAFLRSLSMSATQMIMPDTKLAANLLGEGSMAGQDLIKLIQEKGVEGLTAKTLGKVVADGLKEGGKDWGKAVTRMQADQINSFITDGFLAPEKYKQDNQWQEFKDGLISNAITFAIPSIGGGVNKVRTEGRLGKSMWYEVGSNPDAYINSIKQLQETGKLTEAEANDKIAVVNTLSNIVSKSVPDESTLNGKQLSQQNKEDYASNLLQQAIAKAQKEKVGDDEVQLNQLDKHIDELKKQREEILKNAGEPSVAATVEDAPANTPEEVKAPVDINAFAERIAKGEKMESPEDLQTYENNKSAIEAVLLAKQKASEDKAARIDKSNKEQVGKLPQQEIPSEVNTEKPIADTVVDGAPAVENPTVRDMIDEPVLYDGKRATLYMDGQSVIAKFEEGGPEKVVGPVGEIGDSPISEHGIEEQRPVISINDKGDIEAYGSEYTWKNYSDPLQAINSDAEGNVQSVTLDTKDGQKRTFKGSTAEDIAYQIHLDKITKDNETREFEQFISKQESARKAAEHARLQEDAEKVATATDAKVSGTEGESGAERTASTVEEKTAEKAPDLFNSPQNTSTDGNSEKGNAGQEGSTEENGKQQADVLQKNGGDEGQQKVLNENTDSGSGKEPTADEFGFEYDLPAAKPKAATGDLFAAPGAEAKSAVPEVTKKPIPAAVKNEGPRGAQSADEFFKAPKDAAEETESAKVGDKPKQRFDNTEKVLGHEDVRYLNNGQEVSGRYVLADAKAATPSNDPFGFGITEGYPTLEDGRNPNDRDYTLRENQAKVVARANNYDGRAVENMPIVDKNGIVISGNDRTMAGQRAAGLDTDRKYIEALKKKAHIYGFSEEQVKQMEDNGDHPRLMFVPDKVQPYTTDTYAKYNPKSEGKSKTGIEEAITLGRTVKPEMLETIARVLEPFDTTADFYRNKDAVHQVANLLERNGIINTDNKNAYYDAQNKVLTPEGKVLLQNIMLGKIFNEDVLRVLNEEGVKNVREKMMMAMNNIIGIESMGEKYSLKDAFSNAIHLYKQVKSFNEANPELSRQQAFSSFLQQQNMFESIPENAVEMWELMDDSKKSEIREFTKSYLRSVKDYALHGEDIFATVPPAREDLVAEYKKHKENEATRIKESATKTDITQPVEQPATGDQSNVPGDREGGEGGQSRQEETGTGHNPASAEPGQAAEHPVTSLFDEQPAAPAVAESATPTSEGEKSPIEIAQADREKYEGFLEKKRDKIRDLEEQLDKVSTRDERAAIIESLKKEQSAALSYQKKLRDAHAVITKEAGKRLADGVRSLKIKGPENTALSTPAQIPVAIWNASVELVAQAIEGGAHIRNAVNDAVDFINDRVHSAWDENKFRKILGEDSLHTPTAEEIRANAIDKTGVNAKDKIAANSLMDSIKANKRTLKDALAHIDSLERISPDRKEKIKEYLRSTAKSEIFNATGRELADKHIKDAKGDYDKALESLAQQRQTDMLNSADEIERENLKSKYAAAQAAILSEKTVEAVKDGTIKPVNTHNEDNHEASGVAFQLPDYNFVKQQKQNFQNRYSRLEEAQKHSIVPVTQDIDAATAFHLKDDKALNEIGKMRDFLGHTRYIKDSFLDRMKKDKVDRTQFDLFLYAQHAPERNAHNAKIREEAFNDRVEYLTEKIASTDKPEKWQEELDKILNQEDPRYVLMPDGGSGMTNEQSAQILEEAKADGMYDTYQKYADELRKNVIEKNLLAKYDSGIIGEDEYNHLKDHYQHYVPLKIDQDKLLMDEGATKKEIEQQQIGKTIASSKFNGRDIYRSRGAADRTFHQRNSPLLQTITDYERSIKKGEDNLAAQRLLNFVRVNPNENVWNARRAEYDIIKNKEGKVISVKEMNRPNGNAMTVYQNGEKYYIDFRDRGMQKMVQQVGGATVQKLLQYPTYYTHMVSRLATGWNLEFIAKNPIYDIGDAKFTLRAQNNPEILKNFDKYKYSFFKATRDIIREGTGSEKQGEWTPWIKDWKEAGGDIDFTKQYKIDDIAKKTLKLYEHYGEKLSASQIKEVGHNVGEYITSMEKTTRIISFRSVAEAMLKEAGPNVDAAKRASIMEQAALISRNATVDFRKKGVYGAYINAFKAFANAGTQGISNLVHALQRSPGARRAATFMVMTGIAEREMGNLLSDCKDDPKNCYDEIAENKLAKNFMVPLSPFGGKDFMSVPMPRQWGWFNYVGKTMDKMIRGKIDAATTVSNMTGSMMDYYNPVGGGAPIDQQMFGNYGFIRGMYKNENNQGGSIEPENYKGVLPHKNHWDHTPSFFVKAANTIAEGTGSTKLHPGFVEKNFPVAVSPDMLHYLYQQALAGVGSLLEAPLTAKSWEEEPGARMFFRPNGMAGSKAIYRDISTKAKKELLTEDEQSKVEDALTRLVKSKVITQDQMDGRLDYIESQQDKITTNRTEDDDEK